MGNFKRSRLRWRWGDVLLPEPLIAWTVGEGRVPGPVDLALCGFAGSAPRRHAHGQAVAGNRRAILAGGERVGCRRRQPVAKAFRTGSAVPKNAVHVV